MRPASTILHELTTAGSSDSTSKYYRHSDVLLVHRDLVRLSPVVLGIVEGGSLVRVVNVALSGA